jgi:hypothetical protein
VYLRYEHGERACAMPDMNICVICVSKLAVIRERAFNIVRLQLIANAGSSCFSAGLNDAA